MKNTKKYLAAVCIASLIMTGTIGTTFADANLVESGNANGVVAETANADDEEFTKDSDYDLEKFREKTQELQEEINDLILSRDIDTEDLAKLQNIVVENYELYITFEKYLRKEEVSVYDYKKDMGELASQVAYMYYLSNDVKIVSKYLKKADELDNSGYYYAAAKSFELYQNLSLDSDVFYNIWHYKTYTRNSIRALKDKDQEKQLIDSYNADERNLKAAIRLCDIQLKRNGLKTRQRIELNLIIAESYRFMSDLDDANEYYNAALALDPSDIEILEKYCEFVISLGDSQELSGFISKVDRQIYNNPRSIRLKILKYNALTSMNNITKAVIIKEEILSSDIKTDKDLDIFINGDFFLSDKDKIDAIENGVKSLDETTENLVYAINASKYYLQDEALAKEYVEKLEKIKDKSIIALDALSNHYVDEGEFLKAIEVVDQMLLEFPNNRNLVKEKINLYYSMKRYKKALSNIYYSNNLLFTSFELDSIKINIKIKKYDYVGASKLITRSSNINNDDLAILSELAVLAASYGDYDLTNKIYDKMKPLSNNLEEFETAIEQFNLEIEKITFATKAKEFLNIGYLYKSRDEIESAIGNVLENEDIKTEEILTAVDKIIVPDDKYSLYISGIEYDNLKLVKSTDKVIYKEIDDNTAYIKFSEFSLNTDVFVIEAIDKIENPKEKTLILDLRNNLGGLTDVSNSIAAELLPKCISSTIIMRDGSTSAYNSLPYHTEFKEIVVLIDENTASAAELLTLSLKTYLENVTVMGTTSFGKGIGQSILVDDEAKVYLQLTTHYWNVRENNIMNKGITPDIEVENIEIENIKMTLQEKRNELVGQIQTELNN